MCIANVPVAVTATSSPNGARPLATAGAVIQLNQPAAYNQLARRPAAADLPPRQCSNPRNARRVALRHSLRAVNFDRAIIKIVFQSKHRARTASQVGPECGPASGTKQPSAVLPADYVERCC